MLHWRFKLSLLVVSSVVTASALGRAGLLGLFW